MEWTSNRNSWSYFKYNATLPLLRPSIYLLHLLDSNAELQIFEQIYGLTHSGPSSATNILSLYAFERFFPQQRNG